MSAVVNSNRRRLLVVLDLNGVLLERLRSAECRQRGAAPAPLDMRVKRQHVFLRPRLAEFLDFLFNRFHVAVWSSCEPPTMELLVPMALGKAHADSLELCLDRTSTVHQPTPGKKYDTIKPLSALWKLCDGAWSAHNTVMLDDSCLKARANSANVLCPQEYLVPKSTVPDEDTELFDTIVPALEVVLSAFDKA